MKKKLYIQPDLDIYHFPHQPLLVELSANTSTDKGADESDEVPAPPLGPADIPTDGWNE